VNTSLVRNRDGWLLPFVGVMALVAALFFVTYSVDYRVARPGFPFFTNILVSDANTMRYVLTAVATSLAATLGLMTAIVLVIVQLSANRYTPKIIETFTHHGVNLAIFLLFICTIVYSLWVADTVRADFVPEYSALVSMMLMTLCYALVIPYFLFLFRILNPSHVIDVLRGEAVSAIRRAHARPTLNKEMRKLVAARIQHIADFAMSSIHHVDEEVARHSVWALQSLVSIYLKEKEAFHDDWHVIEDTHMIGSPRRLAEEIIRRQSWVEFRAMRQMRILYRHSSGRLPEINSLIAQALRAFGQAAADRKDFAVLGVVVMFFNSLVRSALAMKDGRACGDTLYQYRLLSEQLLEVQPELAERTVRYFMYYGRMLLDIEIRQIFDTLCYDIRKVNERASKLESPARGRILDDFLSLYDKLDRNKYPAQWRALLKHYVNLASFYLFRGNEEMARHIFDKIKETPLAALRDAQSEITAVTEPLFWEISDRAINFNYMEPEQHEMLETFIGWFQSWQTNRLMQE
jgi:hypothetical protein